MRLNSKELRSFKNLVFKELPEVDEDANVVVNVFADVDVFACLSASLNTSIDIGTFVQTYFLSLF